ncbi:MAG: type I restriction enzyme HsdR N-terminal domain-containing protein [Moheibacter sp.]
MQTIELPVLNFPEKYQFRLKQSEEVNYIFCCIRKKWLKLTPEEWVRQHVIRFLTDQKGCSKSAINSEVVVEINGMKKRADVVVFRKEKPFIIVECKAPEIPISEQVFDQIARYNLELDAEYLMVTNGLQHYYCQMDFENSRYNFLKELPSV